MICYKEKEIIFYVVAIVISSIVAYCLFIKPKVTYGQYYIDNRVKNENPSGLSIGGHLSSHTGAINASPYNASSVNK